MNKLHLLIATIFLLSPFFTKAQQNPYYTSKRNSVYLLSLNDAQLDVGLKTATIFALDDRASLYSNPHFKAMWNLIKLGATLEALLQGRDEPLNDIDLSKKYGQNGYNKTVLMFFLRYGFGGASDLAIQTHFFEFGISPGFFKEGNKGMNIHLDYLMNVFKTNYGAGGNSIARSIDHEVFVGGRMGFDWSFGRSEGEAGFFSHLSSEIKRIANENEFTAAELIRLEEMAEASKVLLPEDVGGRAFHIGPLIGGRISKKILKHGQLFASGQGFYDLMDLANEKGNKENKRSQHHISLSLGFNYAIGGDGKGLVAKGFF